MRASFSSRFLRSAGAQANKFGVLAAFVFVAQRFVYVIVKVRVKVIVIVNVRVIVRFQVNERINLPSESEDSHKSIGAFYRAHKDTAFRHTIVYLKAHYHLPKGKRLNV